MKRIIPPLITLGWAMLIWRLTTTPDFSVTEDTLLSFLISNGGHFIFFGILAILLTLSLSSKIINHKSYIYATIITSFYGLMIELVQRNIPGRSADPVDLLLDTLGAISFLAIINKYLVH